MVSSEPLDIDRAATDFARRQRTWRLMFAIVLLVALGATLTILHSSGKHAERAQQVATEQQKAAVAASSITQTATSVLDRIHGIDDQAIEISKPEKPTVYVWRSGLQNAAHVNPRVLELLSTRETLLESTLPCSAPPALFATTFVITIGMWSPNPSLARDRRNG